MKRITLSLASPYVGLRPFMEREALLFFGRDGHVRELTYEIDLKEKYGLGPIDANGPPFQTWGPSSPHPDLQKLDR